MSGKASQSASGIVFDDPPALLVAGILSPGLGPRRLSVSASAGAERLRSWLPLV
jgi:hypothetical protein